MSSFKKVLDIEKKYEEMISSAHKHSEKELETYTAELHKSVQEQKQELKQQSEEQVAEEKENLVDQGKTLVEEAKTRATTIREFPHKDRAVDMIVEDIQNV